MKLTEEEIEQFHTDVKRLGLNQATIVRATHVHKGNLSGYMNRKSPPSRNFFNEFYHVFGRQLAGLPPFIKTPEIPVETPELTNQVNEDSSIPYVSIATQAGYTQNQTIVFRDNLERFIHPGLPYKGDRFRVFEVKGDSMEPEFKERDVLVCEKADPDKIVEFYPYVIILQADIVLGRLAIKDAENYVAQRVKKEFYSQKLIPLKDIVELWKVASVMNIDKPAGKKFPIEI
jgi:transcriptional regulator with XRE-family HTH domain